MRAQPKRDNTVRRATRSALATVCITGCITGCIAGALALTACEPPKLAEGGAQADADSAAQAAKAPKREATVPADGWNDDIAWRGFEEGLQEAKSTGRPTMLVVHTSWCSKCRALKGVFNSDSTLADLSEDFIMVHVDQDEVPEVTLYAPDGQYIPRVMFLDSDGTLDQALHNPNRASRFRYFYTPQEDLVSTMREALKRHGKTS